MQISVDALVKGAYENWNQVTEYDGKVLNALSINKEETKALTVSTADQTIISDHYFQLYRGSSMSLLKARTKLAI